MIAVGRQGEAPPGVDAGERVLEPEHGGVGARPDHGVQEQLVVVLAPDPARVGEQGEQVAARVVGREMVGRARPPVAEISQVGAPSAASPAVPTTPPAQADEPTIAGWPQ